MMSDSKALEKFEEMVMADPLRSLMPDYFLKKLPAYDPNNPEYYDKLVDHDWQMFRAGFLAAQQ